MPLYTHGRTNNDVKDIVMFLHVLQTPVTLKAFPKVSTRVETCTTAGPNTTECGAGLDLMAECGRGW